MPTKLAKSFGVALKETRKRRGLSLLALSVASGVDKSYIWRLEKGEKNVSLQTVFLLAEALGLQPAELVKLTAKYLD